MSQVAKRLPLCIIPALQPSSASADFGRQARLIAAVLVRKDILRNWRNDVGTLIHSLELRITVYLRISTIFLRFCDRKGRAYP